MNSHMSPCDHMIFVAKSSTKRTRVPRCVTDRLTIRRLVVINLDRPRTSSTAALRTPQHHHLRSSRSESKSFSFLKQAHDVKRAIKEAGEGGGAPARRARGGEAAEAAPVQDAAAPAWSKSKFCRCLFSVKMLYQAWQSLGKMAVHLGV
jgi:hypothetical protein